MIMVDTSVWIDYFNGVENESTDTLHRLLGSNLIITGDIIVTEVLQGFRNERDYLQAMASLLALGCIPMLGRENAVDTADFYRRLRKKGVTVRKTADMMIATWCIKNSTPLLHNDRDFDKIASHLPLKVITGAQV